MAESVHSYLFRRAFNFWPCYFGTGARVTYMSGDWREARVELPLTPRTRNYVGTLFGGSLYASVDPIYMLMLMHILGKEYIVWDKAANVRFKKPGKSTLHAHFLLTEEEIASIKAALDAGQRSVDRIYRVEYKDAQGVVHVEIDKTLYVRKKSTQ